ALHEVEPHDKWSVAGVPEREGGARGQGHRTLEREREHRVTGHDTAVAGVQIQHHRSGGRFKSALRVRPNHDIADGDGGLRGARGAEARAREGGVAHLFGEGGRGGDPGGGKFAAWRWGQRPASLRRLLVSTRGEGQNEQGNGGGATPAAPSARHLAL